MNYQDHNNSQYVYLLITNYCIQNKLNIYKIGKTSQYNLNRFYQYPKGSSLLLLIPLCLKDKLYFFSNLNTHLEKTSVMNTFKDTLPLWSKISITLLYYNLMILLSSLIPLTHFFLIMTTLLISLIILSINLLIS